MLRLGADAKLHVDKQIVDAIKLGVNGVAGLEFNFNPVPIDLVIEYRPGIHIIPNVDPDLIGFGAHVRVYPF